MHALPAFSLTFERAPFILAVGRGGEREGGGGR